MASALQYALENRTLILSDMQDRTEVLAALFRNMHTIKGNARTFDLKLITDAAHAAEQEYDRLRKETRAAWDSALLLAQLDAVDAALQRYADVNEHKLGRKATSPGNASARGAFLGTGELAALQSLAASAIAPTAAQDLQDLNALISRIGCVPLQHLVDDSADALASLALELDKPTPTVEVLQGDVAFRSGFATALQSAFMHMVRNAMDHGIESAQDRTLAGKPAPGHLRFAAVRAGSALELHISDDGRGLALHTLYEKGMAQGLLTPGTVAQAQEVAELIFHSGLSTAEHLTQVSGRGVGMDAVRAFLAEQGATVRVVLDAAPRALGFTPFKFVIGVPDAACLA
jgi:chemotaxis protein histidine kinase CheA